MKFIVLAGILTLSTAQAIAAECKQAGLSAWLKLNDERFCPRRPSAQASDHAKWARVMAELEERFGPVDQNGEFPEDGGCDGGSECVLYSTYQSLYARARNNGGIFAHLSLAEVATVTSYTEYGYQGYNSDLWAEESSSNTMGEIRILNDTLLKLPPYQGTTYRAEFFTDSILEPGEVERRIRNYLPPGSSLTHPLPGHRIFYKGFMSTSLTKSGNYDSYTILVEVEGHSGRYIAPISGREWEEEVLFPAGTWFEVVSIEKRPREKTEESPSDHQWRLKLREL